MILIGIDVGKLSHTFSIINSETGDVLVEPTNFKNNKEGFDFLYDKMNSYKKENILIGMEDTKIY